MSEVLQIVAVASAGEVFALLTNAGMLLILTGVYKRLGDVKGEIGAIKERLNGLERRMNEKADK